MSRVDVPPAPLETGNESFDSARKVAGIEVGVLEVAAVERVTPLVQLALVDARRFTGDGERVGQCFGAEAERRQSQGILSPASNTLGSSERVALVLVDRQRFETALGGGFRCLVCRGCPATPPTGSATAPAGARRVQSAVARLSGRRRARHPRRQRQRQIDGLRARLPADSDVLLRAAESEELGGELI